MNEPEHLNEIEQRLRAMAGEPVAPTVATAHLSAMAAVARPARSPRWHRTKVAAAFGAGLLLGGTSLASAGALGETPQNVVADTAAAVGLNLPGGTERSTEGCEGVEYKNHGQFVRDGGDPKSPCGKPLQSGQDAEGEDLDGGDGPSGRGGVERSTEGCEGIEYKNHGQFVREGGDPESPCGKPVQSGQDDEDDDGEGPAPAPTVAEDEDDDDSEPAGCGAPPWAHGNHEARTPEAVAAWQAECGGAGDDDDDPAPTTTEAPTTTTEAPTTTTEAPTTTVAE
jgi:hypothetical protein